MSSRPGLVTPLTHLSTSYMFVLCIDSHSGYHTVLLDPNYPVHRRYY